MCVVCTQVGLVATCQVVFGLGPSERHASADGMLVVATPGWITGQSYMISAALLCCQPSVLLEGSPVTPPDRFAFMIAHHKLSILKAGSTFLRMIMTGGLESQLASHDLSSLRLGTFCAEPVNEAVHRFACTHLTPNYINSYWATEHGGIVWSRTHDQPGAIRPDACSWPLSWIDGEVMLAAAASDDGAGGGESGVDAWQRAEDGVQGDVVIRSRYPYMALTVWSSEGFGMPSWRGDFARWSRYFTHGAGYVQGDAAVRHPSGAFR